MSSSIVVSPLCSPHLLLEVDSLREELTTHLIGSCGGRGTRAAGWFADYLEKVNDTSIKSMILEGGIKGWVAAGPEYTNLIDGFDANIWP